MGCVKQFEVSFVNKLTEDMTYVALNACNEQFVGVSVRILNEVWWGLLGGDGNEGHTLVRWLEPDDLGAFNRATRFITTVTLAFAPLRLLLLFGSSGRRTKQTQGARE